MDAPWDAKLEALWEKLQALETELASEVEKNRSRLFYKVERTRIRFEREAVVRHRLLTKKIRHYLKDAALLNILTAPVIWSCLMPAVLMDAVLSFYQWVCFPVYGIPRVRRADYILLDRGFLRYLNAIERFNCFYCAYFNGVVAYTREIAARTEQYWCPIKHARRIRGIHSRYSKFLDYGDAEAFRQEIERVRRDFADLKKQ
ncbi:MAG: hypothetical protein ACE5ER_11455 [Nitrospinaceae bacterium]